MDWVDIIVHSAVALVVVGVLVLVGTPHWLAIGLNAAFWFGREWFQKPDRIRVFTHRQSFAEWSVPALIGAGLVMVF